MWEEYALAISKVGATVIVLTMTEWRPSDASGSKYDRYIPAPRVGDKREWGSMELMRGRAVTPTSTQFAAMLDFTEEGKALRALDMMHGSHGRVLGTPGSGGGSAGAADAAPATSTTFQRVFTGAAVGSGGAAPKPKKHAFLFSSDALDAREAAMLGRPPRLDDAFVHVGGIDEPAVDMRVVRSRARDPTMELASIPEERARKLGRSTHIPYSRLSTDFASVVPTPATQEVGLQLPEYAHESAYLPHAFRALSTSPITGQIAIGLRRLLYLSEMEERRRGALLTGHDVTEPRYRFTATAWNPHGGGATAFATAVHHRGGGDSKLLLYNFMHEAVEEPQGRYATDYKPVYEATRSIPHCHSAVTNLAWLTPSTVLIATAAGGLFTRDTRTADGEFQAIRAEKPLGARHARHLNWQKPQSESAFTSMSLMPRGDTGSVHHVLTGQANGAVCVWDVRMSSAGSSSGSGSASGIGGPVVCDNMDGRTIDAVQFIGEGRAMVAHAVFDFSAGWKSRVWDMDVLADTPYPRYDSVEVEQAHAPRVDMVRLDMNSMLPMETVIVPSRCSALAMYAGRDGDNVAVAMALADKVALYPIHPRVPKRILTPVHKDAGTRLLNVATCPGEVFATTTYGRLIRWDVESWTARPSRSTSAKSGISAMPAPPR
jgi:hypothetical protein